jgi:hypothetical protein
MGAAISAYNELTEFGYRSGANVISSYGLEGNYRV